MPLAPAPDQLLDASPDGLVATDLDGVTLSWNGGAERIFGIPAIDALGKPLAQVIGLHALAALDGTFEARARHSSGMELSIIITFRKHDLGTWVVAIADLSALRAHDRELGAEALKRSSLSKVAHELRTPLNAILGFAELLHRGKAGELNAEQLDYVEEILASARKLGVLVDASIAQET